MKKTNTALKLAIAVLALAFATTAFADQPPDNIQGDWTINSTNIENGETVVKHVQIAQYGNRITGYFEGPVQSGPIQGEVNGHRIRFNTVTRTVLHFWGQIYGDSMSGTYGIRGKHAAWQAMRPATTPAPVPPSTGAIYQSQPVLTPPESQTEYQPARYQAPTYQAPAYQSQTTYQSQPEYQSPPEGPAAQPEAQQPTNYSTQGTPQQGSSAPEPAPLSADQIDSLVAPIALYPDALVAQVLGAATFPDQVAYADDWLAQNKSLTGTALTQAVDQQTWDPSVKALTQFPTVLDNLAKNLPGLPASGQAFDNQQADVMTAVQTMRAQAQAAGNLKSTSQIQVVQQSPQTIVIQPANPDVVYVPQYNPTVVYGASSCGAVLRAAAAARVGGSGTLLRSAHHDRSLVRWWWLGRRLRLGLARVECELALLRWWWQHNHHLQPQHVHQQPYLEQHQLQRLPPLGRRSGRIAKPCLVWRQRHLPSRR